MTNRLASATSPYLLQHADNPVDWWEWEPEAFAEAQRRDVPVFLSIGYAACHWCHVMAAESFENDQVAEFLNANYVSIKVDREERPDIDAIYMQATVAMSGHGGWPMTVFLDHQQRPFFAGTYFPPHPAPGRPSFMQLLHALKQAWDDDRAQLADIGDRLHQALDQRSGVTGGAPVAEPELAAAVEQLYADFDTTRGGFGGAPKFPPSMLLEFLLRRISQAQLRAGGVDDAAATHAATERHMVELTLTKMARGGLYDQLGGGFARYSVDANWVVPHFEKMLFDNALLLGVYANWYAISNDPLAARITAQTADFIIDELGTENGGFASSLDADSEGAEGTYYVWTPTQLEAVLGSEDGRWAAELLQVTESGTFEQGSSTLQLPHDADDAARWASVKARLKAARSERVRPDCDDKVVAEWNGFAIMGLVRAAQVLDEPKYLAAALRAGQVLADLHVDDHQRLRRISRGGHIGAPAGVLVDYAAVAEAFTMLAQATTDGAWLDQAGQLLDWALAHFADGEGGFYDTADDAEELLTRPRDPSDNASPSGVSALISALVRYAAVSGQPTYRQHALTALGSIRSVIEQAPRFAGWSLAAAQLLAAGPVELVVISDADRLTAAVPGHELAQAAVAQLDAITIIATPEQAASSTIPLLADRTLVNGEPTAYVCRDMVCQLPVHTVAKLRRQLQQA